jgi:hypothetical protein
MWTAALQHPIMAKFATDAHRPDCIIIQNNTMETITLQGSTLRTKTKRFKKNDVLGRLLEKKKMQLLGWEVISEVETQAYNGKKGLVLGLIFLPLALMGSTKYIDVTYAKK